MLFQHLPICHIEQRAAKQVWYDKYMRYCAIKSTIIFLFLPQPKADGMHSILHSKILRWKVKHENVLSRVETSVKSQCQVDCIIEQFSFECRKVIGFALCTPHDWLKKLMPLFHPIRSKTKTNPDSLAHFFPRFTSATCNYLEF